MAASDPPTPDPPVTDDDLTLELTTSFSETVHAVISAGGVVDTLQRVVDLAVETIEGCDLGLSADGTRGALNLYARYPHDFGVVDRAKGLLLAALAAVALTSAEDHDNQERRTNNLQGALAAREVIGQEWGMQPG